MQLTSVFILLLVVSACKKEVYNLGLTKEFSLQSVTNGATYHIKVGVPENYETSTEKYSTIYVLDDDDNFDFVATECNKISD